MSLDLGLDLDNGVDNGLDDHDNTGSDIDVVVTVGRVVLDGGLDAARAAGAGDIDVGSIDASLVGAAARAGSGNGLALEDGGGNGGANREGGESGAEELHFDGWGSKKVV